MSRVIVRGRVNRLVAGAALAGAVLLLAPPSLAGGTQSTDGVNELLGTPRHASRAAATAENGRIVFQVDGDIYTIGPNGGNRDRLTSRSGDLEFNFSPAWSPTGERIAF